MFLALPKSRNPRSRVNPIPSTAKVMHFQIDVTVCAFWSESQSLSQTTDSTREYNLLQHPLLLLF